jgi:hypothetical protein
MLDKTGGYDASLHWNESKTVPTHFKQSLVRQCLLDSAAEVVVLHQAGMV